MEKPPASGRTARRTAKKNSASDTGGTVGYEAELWRMADALRGIEGQIAPGDTFLNDRFPDLKADSLLGNPRFNVSDWGGDRLREDKRWQYHALPTCCSQCFFQRV